MRILEKIALLREKMEMCKETGADPRSLGVGGFQGPAVFVPPGQVLLEAQLHFVFWGL